MAAQEGRLAPDVQIVSFSFWNFHKCDQSPPQLPTTRTDRQNQSPRRTVRSSFAERTPGTPSVHTHRAARYGRLMLPKAPNCYAGLVGATVQHTHSCADSTIPQMICEYLIGFVQSRNISASQSRVSVARNQAHFSISISRSPREIYRAVSLLASTACIGPCVLRHSSPLH